MDTQKPPIEEACDIVGSQAEMARILDVSPAMVNQLVKGLRPVPVEHCLAIERATRGRVTRKALRPKDFDRIWGDPTDYSAHDTRPTEPELVAAEAAEAGLIERRSRVRRADDRAMLAAMKGQGA